MKIAQERYGRFEAAGHRRFAYREEGAILDFQSQLSDQREKLLSAAHAVMKITGDAAAPRLRLAQSRTVGTGVRNKGQTLKTDLAGWIAENHRWVDDAEEAVRVIDEADAEWFKTLDASPPARVPLMPINSEQADEHEHAFRMHDHWLRKLEELYQKYSSRG